MPAIFTSRRLDGAIDFWVKKGYLIIEQSQSQFEQSQSIKYRLTPDGELLANLIERLSDPLPSKGQFQLLISILNGKMNEVV